MLLGEKEEEEERCKKKEAEGEDEKRGEFSDTHEYDPLFWKPRTVFRIKS